jgi:hypothetical protein
VTARQKFSLLPAGNYVSLSGADRAKSSWQRGRALNDTGKDDKARDREIAQNEAERQTIGDIRVSSWAIAVAVIIGLAAVGWVLLHNR